MPQTVEIDGVQTVVWTDAEHQADVQGLKVTNQNLKAEKEEIKSKLDEAKEATRTAEEAKAQAEGDKATLERIAAEREAEKQTLIDEQRTKHEQLLSQIKGEKTTNAINALVTKLGAGGEKNEDLRDLIQARFGFEFDMESQLVRVSGDGVESLEQLENQITSSGRYSAYLASSGASGGGSAGGGGAGAQGKRFDEMTGAELSALRNQNPAEYARLKTEYQNR